MLLKVHDLNSHVPTLTVSRSVLSLMQRHYPQLARHPHITHARVRAYLCAGDVTRALGVILSVADNKRRLNNDVFTLMVHHHLDAQDTAQACAIA